MCDDYSWGPVIIQDGPHEISILCALLSVPFSFFGLSNKKVQYSTSIGTLTHYLSDDL